MEATMQDNIYDNHFKLMMVLDKHSDEFQIPMLEFVDKIKAELLKNESIKNKDQRIMADVKFTSLYATLKGWLPISIQKTMSRYFDDRDLRLGNKTREDLRKENHLFAPIAKRAIINFAK